MKIILYNPTSKGGNFMYALQLAKAYQNILGNDNFFFLLPKNAGGASGSSIYKILLADQAYFGSRFVSKTYFLFRSLYNPIRLYFFLRNRPGHVILNDFEQLTSLLWVPLFKQLRGCTFSVILHDPDRDAYPPSKWLSQLCMRKMMSIMTLGIYHDYLPDKSYYSVNKSVRYLSVPHGNYEKSTADQALHQNLLLKKEGYSLMAIIGNIRSEKNYELAIHSLKYLQQVKLVIAGAPANTSVSTEPWKRLAKALGVAERIFWIDRYLTEAELAAVIEATDLVLLNYKPSFASQSGVLNLIAPYGKNFLASRIKSSLTEVMQRFSIGNFVEPDSLDNLIKMIPETLAFPNTQHWDDYMKWASWENHVAIVLNELKNR